MYLVVLCLISGGYLVWWVSGGYMAGIWWIYGAYLVDVWCVYGWYPLSGYDFDGCLVDILWTSDVYLVGTWVFGGYLVGMWWISGGYLVDM